VTVARASECWMQHKRPSSKAAEVSKANRLTSGAGCRRGRGLVIGAYRDRNGGIGSKVALPGAYNVC